MWRRPTTRAASAGASAQLRAARSASACAAKAAQLVDPVGGLGRKLSTRREDEVEVNQVVAPRVSEGQNLPQRSQLAVVVPISPEASGEASVVVSCSWFWPFWVNFVMWHVFCVKF